jgi:ApaG protein
MSEAVTEGIRVQVEATWLPEHSSPRERRWAFSYTVTITNEGSEAATLTARHWIITDASGQTEHVRGPGVVGYQPDLEQGQSFTYTSVTPDAVH